MSELRSPLLGSVHNPFTVLRPLLESTALLGDRLAGEHRRSASAPCGERRSARARRARAVRRREGALLVMLDHLPDEECLAHQLVVRLNDEPVVLAAFDW